MKRRLYRRPAGKSLTGLLVVVALILLGGAGVYLFWPTSPPDPLSMDVTTIESDPRGDEELVPQTQPATQPVQAVDLYGGEKIWLPAD